MKISRQSAKTTPKALPPMLRSKTAEEMFASLMGQWSQQLQQQVLSDAEMRRAGYSEKAIRL